MKIKAMVVDDSGIMRKMVMRSLKESGLAEFEFVEGVDGVDALEKFNPDEIQMMFVDWNMPNMNGLEFITKVREMTSHHIPVAMITTERTMEKVEEAIEQAGVDTFICKPFTTDVMKKKLGLLFDKIEDDKEGFFGALGG